MAVFRRGDDLRVPRLAVLRDRRRRTLATARRRCRGHAVDRDTRCARAAAASAVSERYARLLRSPRLRASPIRIGRLSRAEPGISVRHFDALDRWFGGGGFLARWPLPLCVHRGTA